MTFRIEINDTQINAALAALQSRVTDMRPVLQSIGDSMVDDIALRFAESKGPDGARWKDPAALTLMRRRHGKGGGSDKPLVNMGHLASSFSARADANSVIVGTNWMAGTIPGGAAIHQFGGQAGRGRKVTIPARPFLPADKFGKLAPDTQQAVMAMLQEYLTRPK